MNALSTADREALPIVPGCAVAELHPVRPVCAMQFDLVDPICEPTWDDLALSHPERTFFHSSAWAKVLSKTYGHKALYLRCSIQGELAALIPVMEVRSPITGCRGVGLPFTDFCGPFLFGQAGADCVIDALSQLAKRRKWKYFEIREGRILRRSATPSVTFYGHTLNLRGDMKDCLLRLSSSCRRAIRKAEASDLEVGLSRTFKSMEAFYELHVQTRKRHGVPPQPKSFFDIDEEVIRRDLGFVVVATYHGRSVAAAIYFHIGARAVYKFGASDKSFQEMRGNNLVMWKAIAFLVKNQFETLHLGRTSLINDGLRRFKLSWGATEERLDYFKFNTAANRWIGDSDKSPDFILPCFERCLWRSIALRGRHLICTSIKQSTQITYQHPHACHATTNHRFRSRFERDLIHSIQAQVEDPLFYVCGSCRRGGGAFLGAAAL